jgi:hypothetical protein
MMEGLRVERLLDLSLIGTNAECSLLLHTWFAYVGGVRSITLLSIMEFGSGKVEASIGIAGVK